MAEAAPLAEAMAEMVISSDSLLEARALSHRELFHKMRDIERERIVELLGCRTTADIARGDALRRAAQTWLETAEAPLSRSHAGEESRLRPARPVI
ncbi:MAG TPA: hypothetical protein VFU30_10800 [Gaiellaceae bacterium]|nr:hypothetical protein [Gaiellaceae bacterium]